MIIRPLFLVVVNIQAVWTTAELRVVAIANHLAAVHCRLSSIDNVIAADWTSSVREGCSCS